MSVLPTRDICNVGVAPSIVNGPEYLTDVSPKHKPWDTHRAEADEVQSIYGGSPIRRYQRYAERIEHCSQTLEFARSPPLESGKQKLTLKTAWFCRVRHCPVCQWRRALQWQARLYQALPKLLIDFPDARFLFLTLTVRNCVVDALRYTLGLLSQGWKRLIQLRVWPALGWIRAVEITRSKDGTAHPHYHALLMVPASYFGAGYLKQAHWRDLWQECLRINYTPQVHVKAIQQTAKRSWLKVNRVSIPQMWAIVSEILKYSVKPSDMMRDHAWFLTMTDQITKMRAVAIGGALKPYLRKRVLEDLTSEPGEEPTPEELQHLFFGWKTHIKRYRRITNS